MAKDGKALQEPPSAVLPAQIRRITFVADLPSRNGVSGNGQGVRKLHGVKVARFERSEMAGVESTSMRGENSAGSSA
jgi:hypothetical protein